ncbi:FecR family protein [Acetobacter ascendens]|uniref:Histidine kinase n=1 Tax=Acetobacter ascendens TaxID=481146 RepID=A0A1Y0VA03_9PROT|nr:FecR domain-containing protein [Acetobacter ascendens]ARW11607.1 hypothetical protein S101447_02569 [Acetobacter ascendens]
MTVIDDPIRQQASREATQWLILLQEEPDEPEVRAKFEAWLGAASVNREAWAQTQTAMGFVNYLSPSYAGNWQQKKRNVVPPPLRHRLSSRAISVGSALALAACFALFFAGPDFMLHMRADAITGTAETRVLSLSDGSSITLAPGSAVSINTQGNHRSITLLAGEALFSIIHDPAHPFIVKAGDFTTTDIGTIFDVRWAQGAMNVAVRTGRVRVNGGAIPAQGKELGTGQALTASATEVYNDILPAEQVGVWADGLLVANDEPLGEVVTKLKPYLHGVVIVSPYLASQRVSGVYSLSNPARALEAIAQARQRTVHRYSPWVTILR